VPEPIQDGVHNALNNLSEPVNFINFMLQLKPGKALQALARFAINSTIGVAGLFDVAKNKPFHIEYRRNGFANTFGYYGIKQGPFLYLPLIGPTTARDLVGRLLDLSVLPLAGKPFNSPQYSLVTGTLRSIDDRVIFDALFKQMRNDCPDYYAAEREWYLQTRKAEIEKLHGHKYDIDAHLPDCLVPSPPPPLVPYTPSVAPQPAPTGTSPVEPAAQPSVTPVKPTAAPGSQSAPTTVPASEPAPAPSALPAPAPQPDAATM
jgi:phospholipid-binding lipoprotein MlaA